MKAFSSSNWIVALLMVNLGLGVAIGILVDQHLLAPAQAIEDSMKPNSRIPRPEGMQRPSQGGAPSPRNKEMILNKLSEELQLDDAQRGSLSSLFDKHHNVQKEFHHQMRQEMMQQRKTFMTEVEAFLTVEQAQRFREIRSKIDHKRMEMMRMKRGDMPGQGREGPPGQRPEWRPRRPDLEE
ncbi:MAG: hypothetical protein O3B01_05930 [Planctomycetota bacterium]|nr:hypothetical protein [Planctomycetota bacterium]MDA1138102.1 hypothetical protein [Planctomycetota bacterium]